MDIELTVMSFGYLYGLPLQADTVIDVRGLPNPFYLPELKEQTGLDQAVQEYIFQFPESNAYLQVIVQLLELRLKLYRQWNSPLRKPLCIAIGCSGGRHRSVAMTLRVAQVLTDWGCKVTVYHREIGSG